MLRPLLRGFRGQESWVTGTWLWESYFQPSSWAYAPFLPELPEPYGLLPSPSFPAKKSRHSPLWKGWL